MCSTFLPSYRNRVRRMRCGADWQERGRGRGRGKTNSHGFADQPELLLDGFPRCDLARRSIRAE